MKVTRIFFLLLICLFSKNLLATEIVAGLGYGSWKHGDYSSFGAVTPSLEIYVPVYKNLSAGFGLSYTSVEYGAKSDLAGGVNYPDPTSLSGKSKHSIVPLQLSLKYDYEFARNWKVLGIIRAGLSAGQDTYHNSTTCTNGVSSGSCIQDNQLVDASERNTDVLEIGVDKVFGFDVGFSYKQYLFLVTYSAMNVANTYNYTHIAFDNSDPNNPQTKITGSDTAKNKNSTTMQTIGFKIAYMFDF
ncbi:hypothetical protein HPDP_01114 [Candidatus Hepatincola sp. Pdp]